MTTDEPAADDDDTAGDSDETSGERSARNRLEAGADRAVEQFDQSVVDLLAWLLDTETRARIYIYLRKYPDRTSGEIADGTGLYPSTVRESLAELHDEDIVDRDKRESQGAGNNPYEYTAIPPSALVGSYATQIQDQLNAVCNLDRYIQDRAPTSGEPDAETSEPINIEVREPDDE